MFLLLFAIIVRTGFHAGEVDNLSWCWAGDLNSHALSDART